MNEASLCSSPPSSLSHSRQLALKAGSQIRQARLLDMRRNSGSGGKTDLRAESHFAICYVANPIVKLSVGGVRITRFPDQIGRLFAGTASLSMDIAALLEDANLEASQDLYAEEFEDEDGDSEEKEEDAGTGSARTMAVLRHASSAVAREEAQAAEKALGEAAQDIVAQTPSLRKDAQSVLAEASREYRTQAEAGAEAESEAEEEEEEEEGDVELGRALIIAACNEKREMVRGLLKKGECGGCRV
ncbi:hypothetical protein B484DRAFT_402664 [Ochromonadaceae sp. CCMP2298]|nr:hypothetical protein B484DRAFT_402664 [Ochromonadaceae sp. CCMP2298]